MQAQEFARKYELYQCVQCGKCTGCCPVSLKSPLHTRRLVYETMVLRDRKLVFDDKGLWDCTTCTACETRCPKSVSPVNLVRGMRGVIIEAGRVPATIRDALESVFKYKNPWGRFQNKRSEWAEGLDLKDITKGERAELLCYIGCTPAYDPRIQTVAKALVSVLRDAKVDFGFMGNEEMCCGNEVLRMGEEGLFELLVEDNLALFEKYDIGHIVTISPHCYNTFKNEYTGLSNNTETQHYTQYLAELLDAGAFELTKALKKKVIYHDPCFLGRQNSVFEPPRKLLEAIPGVDILEFYRSRTTSLCCEGGGGRMWVEAAPGDKLAEQRVEAAIENGAELIATACPFCITNLEDAVKTTGNEGKIAVRDVLELLAAAL